MINVAQNRMPSRHADAVRCAVYTRKSTDENLDSDFNSLDAQRESAENYIKSQAHEGWTIMPTRYDDGAYSGSTMERPGVQKLLRDVAAGKIDVVVVYRIDRLSRNLLEFNQTLKFFEQYDVSFVSVTEQFNTKTPMGRFAMNVVSSFSQMEREVIAERIRDKVAASKRRGIWMGGVPPLGYDVDRKEKKLIVNAKEAVLVRLIFRRYLELRSATTLVRELNEQGHRTKTWVTKKGRKREGMPFDKNKVYKILQNETCLGLTKHKGRTYPGEHEAIIERSLFDEVKTVLAANTVDRGNTASSKTPAMLRGILTCGHCGRAMSPTYSMKKGRKYRYYVCQTAVKHGYDDCELKSVSADKLEGPIKEAIRKLISNPEMVKQTLDKASHQMDDEVMKLAAREKQQGEELAMLRANAERMLSGDLQSAFVRDELARLENQAVGLESDLELLRARLEHYRDHPLDEQAVLAAFADLDVLFDELFPAERERLVRMIVEKIRVYREHMEVTFRPDALLDIAGELGDWRLRTEYRGNENVAETMVVIPLTLETYRPKIQVIQPNGDVLQTSPLVAGRQSALETSASTPLNIALAHRWMKLLESGQVKSIMELVQIVGRDEAKVRKTLTFADLDPVEAARAMC